MAEFFNKGLTLRKFPGGPKSINGFTAVTRVRREYVTALARGDELKREYLDRIEEPIGWGLGLFDDVAARDVSRLQSRGVDPILIDWVARTLDHQQLAATKREASQSTGRRVRRSQDEPAETP